MLIWSRYGSNYKCIQLRLQIRDVDTVKIVAMDMHSDTCTITIITTTIAIKITDSSGDDHEQGQCQRS